MVLENFEDLLPNNSDKLTKNDLIPLFKSHFFRTYSIRTLLNEHSNMFIEVSVDDKDIIDHSRLARLGTENALNRLGHNKVKKEKTQHKDPDIHVYNVDNI